MSASRLVVSLVVAAVLAVGTHTRGQSTNNWQVGDLFVGIGDPFQNAAYSGEYRVYRSGTWTGEIVRDPAAGYTTGCYYNPVTASLWTTSFTGLTLNEYDGATWQRQIGLGDVLKGKNPVAVESIAFDRSNHAFVGLPYGASPDIAELTRDGTLVRMFTVPAVDGFRNGAVDWLDVGHDTATGHRIIYYTDESLRDSGWQTVHPGYTAKIRRYDVDLPGPLPDFDIPDGTAFALRLLPNNAGLLVAAPGRVWWLTMQGEQVTSFWTAGEQGLYALNIAPDGQHFWTASASTGRVYQFDIRTQQLVKTISTPVTAVNGLCVVREYTAAENTCRDATGAMTVCPYLGGLYREGTFVSERPFPGGAGYSLAGAPPGVGVDPATGVISGTLTCDSAGTYRPVLTISGGTTFPFTWVVQEACSDSSTRPPDCSHASLAVSTIWPPDGRMVTVTPLRGVTDPDGDDASITITGVTQDELVDAKGTGDANRAPDAVFSGAQASVRAERDGTGDGRVYTISFTARDERGGACTGTVPVGVPHDRRLVKSAQSYDSVTGARMK